MKQPPDPIGDALRLAVRNGQSRLYFAAPLGGCCDQADRGSLVTELKRYRVGLAAHEAGGSPPRYDECGCCGHRHRPEFGGDCRDDSERFTDAELDAFHGAEGWTPVDLEDEPDSRIITKGGKKARINMASAGRYAVAIDGRTLQASTVEELRAMAAERGWN